MTTPRDRVQCTRESAERIADVVRTVELAPTPGRPLSFEQMAVASTRKTFRMATFSGAWSIGSAKVVTLRGSTATLSATNLLLNVPSAGTRNCAIAKDGTAWYLVFPQVKAETKTFVSDVTLEATLNTSNCTITIARTLATSTHTIIVMEAL